MRHPIVGSSRSPRGADSRLRATIVFRISALVAEPFFSPNASQARESGAIDACPKTPPPAITLYGAFSLKRNKSPGFRALNSLLPDGCQKFTSSGSIPDRKSNHGLCVTPTKILTIARNLHAYAQIGKAMRTITAILRSHLTHRPPAAFPPRAALPRSHRPARATRPRRRPQPGIARRSAGRPRSMRPARSSPAHRRH
jgi:hypothetical protein